MFFVNKIGILMKMVYNCFIKLTEYYKNTLYKDFKLGVQFYQQYFLHNLLDIKIS